MDPLSRLLDPQLLIPVVSILMPIAIVFIALAFAQRYQERKHQTIVNLLEKGLPVPRELLRGPRRGGSPMMRALSLVGLGLGTSAFLGAMFGTDHGLWAAGLIPLFVGAAQLLAIRLETPRADVEDASGLELP